MSGAWGLHKAAGGIRARWQQAWAAIEAETLQCRLEGCDGPASGLVERWDGLPGPICTTHTPQARRVGYTVYTSPEERDR